MTTKSYDGADELTGITYSSTVNSTPNVTYSYTNEGKPYQMTDGTGTTTYSYDADQRTTQVQNGTGAVLAYSYDADSNLTCIAYPGSGNTCSSSPGSSNHVVDYTFDHDDRMSSITDWAGDTLNYTYSHDSLPQTLSANSSAVVEQTTFDHADQATDISTTAGSTTLLDLSYGYDNDGNPTQETPTIGSTAQTVQNFANNAANWVAYYWTGAHSLKPAQPNVTYGNDGELNRNGPDTTSQAMGYDQAGELCWVYSSTVSSPSCSSPPSGSTSYSFDADGERTTVVPSSGNSQAYAWNAANELRCANTNGSTCSISSPTSTTTLYAYDGNGLRTSSTTNSTTTAYTWDTTTAIPRFVASGSTSYVYGDGSAPVVQINGTASDLVLTDPIGSVHGLVQLSSGSLQNLLVNYTDYDTYGVPSNAGGLTQSHTSINANWSVTSGIGYAGSYEDATGLVYMQHRYYDASTGQFLSADAELQVTRQPYVYSMDNPLSYGDPNGLIPTPPPGPYGVPAYCNIPLALPTTTTFVVNFIPIVNITLACKTNQPPWRIWWSFTLADQQLIYYVPPAFSVNEFGMQWWKNGAAMPQNGQHLNEPPDYLFHGTFSYVGPGDLVTFQDKLHLFSRFFGGPIVGVTLILQSGNPIQAMGPK